MGGIVTSDRFTTGHFPYGKWGLYVMNADGSDRCPMFETALDGLEFEYGFVPERMVSWTE
jgi:hypothetical protein